MKAKKLNLASKFMLIALGLGVFFLGVTAYLSYRLITRQFEEQYEEKALLVAKHILSDLEEGMIRRVHQKLPDILDE